MKYLFSQYSSLNTSVFVTLLSENGGKIIILSYFRCCLLYLSSLQSWKVLFLYILLGFNLTWLLVIYWGLGLLFIVKSNCVCRPILFLQAVLIWTIYLVWPEVLSYKLFPVWLIAFAPLRFAHLEVKEIQILLVAQNPNHLNPVDFR